MPARLVKRNEKFQDLVGVGEDAVDHWILNIFEIELQPATIVSNNF
jgi:hypothetical protein